MKSTARKVTPKGGPQPPPGRIAPKENGVADVDPHTIKTSVVPKQHKAGNKVNNVDREAIQVSSLSSWT